MSRPSISEDLKGLLDSLPDMDFELFASSISAPLPECFRVNTLKLSEERIIEMLREDGWAFEKLRWARFGYKVTNSREESLGASLEHMVGLIYLQGPLSMLPAEVLDVRPGHLVLDLCAAPGSKSTQLAQLMENKGALVCNDVSQSRIKPLISNLQRFGVYNCVITLTDGSRFYKWGRETFDRVLVDAPCSSLGIIAKDWRVAYKYNERISMRISNLQKRLLLSAFDCLKPGGILVYSTCTIHPSENEEVVSWLLEKRESARVLNFSSEGLRRRAPLEEWRGFRANSEVKKCFKAYPYDNGSEGFFVAKIKKGE